MKLLAHDLRLIESSLESTLSRSMSECIREREYDDELDYLRGYESLSDDNTIYSKMCFEQATYLFNLLMTIRSQRQKLEKLRGSDLGIVIKRIQEASEYAKRNDAIYNASTKEWEFK